VENIINVEKGNDLILNMKSEFKQLTNNYCALKESESKYLLKLSITDCLTSVYNHRYLYEYFETKVTEGISMLAILFCDIDHFKQVNDKYN
jgi:PleD family two-component response regulator